jgi:hypothetical protein
LKTESLMNAVDATLRANISLGIFLAIGFPHDRPEHLRATARDQAPDALARESLSRA